MGTANFRISRRAFTLIEFYSVVMIVGMLAAIVMMSMHQMDSSLANSITTNLKATQNGINSYRLDHNGACPDFATKGWSELTGDIDGDGRRELGVKYYVEINSTINWAVASEMTSSQTRVTVSDKASETGSSVAAWVWNTTDNKIYASYFDEKTGKVTKNATD